MTCSDSQGLFSFCTCSQSYKQCTLFDLILTWLSPSADPLLNARFFFFFLVFSFLSVTGLFSLFLRALLYPSIYSFLLSWLPFLAFLKIPLVSFSSVSGHICMHAHTHSIKVKNFILVLTVAIKGAPTKCCNPFIMRLPTHSMQATLPFGSSILSPSLLSCVCVKSRMERKCKTEDK